MHSRIPPRLFVVLIAARGCADVPNRPWRGRPKAFQESNFVRSQPTEGAVCRNVVRAAGVEPTSLRRFIGQQPMISPELVGGHERHPSLFLKFLSEPTARLEFQRE